jgi:hypothetical protein
MAKVIPVIALVWWLSGCTIIEHSEHTTVTSDASIEGINITL